MKIVLAFDSFKGSLDSVELAHLAAKIIKEKLPQAEIVKVPLADGGENTAAILANHFGGGLKVVGQVEGPLESIITLGAYGDIPQQKTAIVEMAIASGIALCNRDNLQPLNASTYGTGQILKYIVGQGYEKIYLTLGGSATTDGGTGAAAAFGYKFFDKEGNLLKPCGGNLKEIVKIIPPESIKKMPKILCLCDVQNPLTGPTGSAAVYGPQKGADSDDIKILDEGLVHLAKIIREQLGKEIEFLPGAGAAGGFGGGAVAFFNAQLVSGTTTILEWLKFSEIISDADWVITGEGCLDNTSFNGKVLSGVSAAVKNSKAKLAVVAGRVKASGKTMFEAGIQIAEPCAPQMISDEVAFAHAKELFQQAISRVIEVIDLN